MKLKMREALGMMAELDELYEQGEISLNDHTTINGYILDCWAKSSKARSKKKNKKGKKS